MSLVEEAHCVITPSARAPVDAFTIVMNAGTYTFHVAESLEFWWLSGFTRISIVLGELCAVLVASEGQIRAKYISANIHSRVIASVTRCLQALVVFVVCFLPSPPTISRFADAFSAQ